jgi:endoplasmic reticulum-Golgi intermediate compartment protein 3
MASMRQRKSALQELQENPNMEGLKSALPKMDFFPKLEEEHRVRSDAGGVSSLVAFAFMAVLFLSEFASYVRPPLEERIEVDKTMGERLRIHMNVTFHALTCAEVEVIAMDVLGEHQLGVKSTTHKHRLSKAGEPIGEKFLAPAAKKTTQAPLPADYCGSCYGAVNAAGLPKCCNTCDAVRDAYNAKGWSTTEIYATSEQCLRENKDPAMLSKKGEGCEVEGVLAVSKVAGNFHIALGKSKSVDGRLIHEFNPAEAEHFNTSHRINFLSFGPPVPGVTSPLDGASRIVDEHKSATAVYQYFIKIVPTSYHDGRMEIRSNQYSFTEKTTPVGEGSDAKAAYAAKHHAHHGHGHRHPAYISALPGVFFVYELSPFVHVKSVGGASFFHFVTRCCAIIGGVFSFATMLGTMYEKVKATKK